MRYPRLLAAGFISLLSACDDSLPSTAQPYHTDRGWFLVFFAFDDAKLSPTALSSLGHAARIALEDKGQTCVTAHADRAGSDAYNMELSRRRAEAVRDELVRLGVPPDKIRLVWRGEGQPLVQTADGVREAQNRRVEVYAWCAP